LASQEDAALIGPLSLFFGETCGERILNHGALIGACNESRDGLCLQKAMVQVDKNRRIGQVTWRTAAGLPTIPPERHFGSLNEAIRRNWHTALKRLADKGDGVD
jgi:hypothetical protein